MINEESLEINEPLIPGIRVKASYIDNVLYSAYGLLVF